MFIAFTLGGLAYLLLGSVGHQPWLFVLVAALIFFTWGEIFSLFPSTCTDAFGPKYATTNTALLYTAKGTSAFLVPLANLIKSSTGSWYTVFMVAAVMNFVVVQLALFVLRPLRRSRESISVGHWSGQRCCRGARPELSIVSTALGQVFAETSMSWKARVADPTFG